MSLKTDRILWVQASRAQSPSVQTSWVQASRPCIQSPAFPVYRFHSDNQSDMDKSNPPQEINFSENINEHWKLRKQEQRLYISVTKKTKKPDEVKSSILLTCIRPFDIKYSPWLDGEEGKYVIRLYLMMTPWKCILIIFYNNLIIIAPL